MTQQLDLFTDRRDTPQRRTTELPDFERWYKEHSRRVGWVSIGGFAGHLRREARKQREARDE